MLDSGTLAQKLVSGLLDALLAVLVVEVEAHDGGVLSWGGGAGEGEHDALGDVVKGAVSLEADGLPLVGAENPVAHVVDRGIASGSARHRGLD